MRRSSGARRSTPAPTQRMMTPFIGLSLLIALFVVACAAGGGNSSTRGNRSGQSQPFSTPPTVQTTPPVATSVGPDLATMSGVPGIRPTKPGQVPAYSPDDMATYVKQHGLPNVGSSGSPTVTQMVFLPNTEVEDLTGYKTGLQGDSLVGYVELQGSFAFPAPPDFPALQLPVAYMMFNSANGNIIGWGGLKQPSTVSTNQPTPTPGPTQLTPIPTTVPATPTPVPVQPTATPQKPPQLSVSPAKATEYCFNNGYPTNITVTNSGGGILIWNGSGPSFLTLSSANGTLGAGASQTVKLSGLDASGVGSFELSFTSNGGDAKVTIDCR